MDSIANLWLLHWLSITNLYQSGLFFIISPIWFLKVENLKVPPRLINHKTCF